MRWLPTHRWDETDRLDLAPDKAVTAACLPGPNTQWSLPGGGQCLSLSGNSLSLMKKKNGDDGTEEQTRQQGTGRTSWSGKMGDGSGTCGVKHLGRGREASWWYGRVGDKLKQAQHLSLTVKNIRAAATYLSGRQ